MAATYATGTAGVVAAAFRRSVEAKDMAAAAALLADDVVFNSPIVFAPYHGRDAVTKVLLAVSEVFEDFRYTAEFSSENGHVLAFAARVDDRELEGVDMIRVADAAIAELTVMVRPYSAATALRERMAALLAG